MDLKRIKDNSDSGRFTLGNLNDYVNLLYKINPIGRNNLTIEDLQSLEDDFSGVVSYRVSSNEDDTAIKSFKMNDTQYLNIYSK